MPAFALKYRPSCLDEIVGQSHILKKDAPLRKLIEANSLSHTFFYGPPGCGKTTLARVIALVLGKPFYEMNGTSLKVEELRKIFKTYANALEKPLIFIDEVHRLSKNQQEALLPFMENYSALIIGASTENPYYTLTAAIRSRSHNLELKSIDNDSAKKYLLGIIKYENIGIENDALEYLISSSCGDLRSMLNLLESAHIVSDYISLEVLKGMRPHAMQPGSIQKDSHYDLTSAMIKSIRGSDIDASIYYLARLIEGGEPAEYIARRLAILASEDIGNANPAALNLASSTLNIVKYIGYPEARISLSQLVIYLASSPKSNSAYIAINKALSSIASGEILDVPRHLKTHSDDYKYPYDFGGWIEQPYLEKPMDFYESRQIGFEQTLYEWHQKITFTKK